MLAFLGSRSIRESMRLLSYLPQQRIIGLRWLVAISFIPGLLDFVSIAIIGRLTGSLVGGRLGNLVPGIKVFGGNQFEQALWLIGLFVFIIWIQSLARIFLRVMQERTASAIWLINNSLKNTLREIKPHGTSSSLLHDTQKNTSQ